MHDNTFCGKLSFWWKRIPNEAFNVSYTVEEHANFYAVAFTDI